MGYTFKEIDDICHDHDKVRAIIEQRDTFRKELIDMAKENKELRDKWLRSIQPDTELK